MAWQSARLIYRALDKDDDDGLLATMSSDSDSYMGASPNLASPQGKSEIAGFQEFLKNKLLSAVICLPAPVSPNTPAAKDNALTKPIPIGLVNLAPVDPRQIQHRHTEIGVNVLKQYQGQGYGTEAIEWALNWGFQYAGMHRIEINALGHNTGACRLYERMGFKPEGRKRDWLFLHGKFWVSNPMGETLAVFETSANLLPIASKDMVMFAMLEDEWRQRKAEKESLPTPSAYD